MQKEASYLDWFEQPPNGQEPAKELSEWFGFRSFSDHIFDCSDAEYGLKVIKNKYCMNDDERALELFKKAQKLYDAMMGQMSKPEKIEYLKECNKKMK